MTQALAHRTLASALVDALRQRILSGSFAAGVQLRQDALAKEFGVSRIPVREALFQLEAEGLVEIVPHKGAIVAAFSPAEIDDVLELRALLEPRLLAASAPRLTASDHALIDQLDARFAAAIANEDVASWGELNAQLHLALYARADLSRTLGIVTALLQASDRLTRLQMRRAAAMKRAQREHRQLIALCRAGDIDVACAQLVAHIDAVRKDLHRLVGGSAAAKRKDAG